MKKVTVEELTDKDLLRKYFYLASKFEDGLDDFQLDTFYKAEKEILKRMGSNESLETMAENIEEVKKMVRYLTQTVASNKEDEKA